MSSSVWTALCSWKHDAVLHRLFRNASTLLGGSAVSSVINLASFAITARALGVEQFGVLALITTYVLIVDRLINFQSWQALIKFGTGALQSNREQDFKVLIKFGTTLDVACALLATVVSATLAPIIAVALGWSSEQALAASVYSIVIFSNLSGTPIAVLRLFSRFRLSAVQNVFAATFKLAGVGVAFLMGVGLWGFLIVWALTTILGNLLLLTLCWRLLYVNGIRDVRKASLAVISRRFPGLWGFVWTTNLNSSVHMLSRELDLMLVGGVLGSAAAGVYKVAKQIAAVLGKLTDPIYQAIYPELSRFFAGNEMHQFKRLMLRSSLMAGTGVLIAWLAFVVFGEWALAVMFGRQYVQAFPVASLYMAATVIAVFALPLQPAMLAMGRPHMTLWVHFSSAVIYLPTLYVAMQIWGLVGAGVAFIAYYLIWSLAMLGIELLLFRRMKLASHSASFKPLHAHPEHAEASTGFLEENVSNGRAASFRHTHATLE